MELQIRDLLQGVELVVLARSIRVRFVLKNAIPVKLRLRNHSRRDFPFPRNIMRNPARPEIVEQPHQKSDDSAYQYARVPEQFGGALDRAHDRHVRAAAALEPREPAPDVVLARMRVGFEQGGSLGQSRECNEGISIRY